MRLLLHLFQDRFFENDVASPGGGFRTNINQVLGMLVAAGLFVAYFLTPSFVKLSLATPGGAVQWPLRTLRLFFPVYSFAVVGFAAVFHWDTLFPDRRDFLILTPFPIRLRELCAARIAALLRFLLLLAGAVNLFPNLMVILFSFLIPQSRASGPRLAVAQITVTAAASLFAFLAIAAFQGLLISLTTPRIFQRISPWIQMFGMSVMILALLTYPIYSVLLKSAAHTHALWLWFFPPVWFSGLYDLILGGPGQPLADLGRFGLKMLCVAIAVFSLTWIFGFRLHYRRALETESLPPRVDVRNYSARLIRPPQERAIFDFSGKTLARSQKHQLFLVTYLSVGVSIGLLFAIAVRDGMVVWSHDGLRSLPFTLAFFVLSGFRALFQFPADLPSNWLFQITEDRWSETSRRATRKRVFVSGLLPVLLFASPFEIATAGWRNAPTHLALQLLAGALLIELLFWSFDKVPFTCSYFPGATNLAILAALYLYGFTTYSLNLADLENALDRSVVPALLCFATTAILLRFSWRRRQRPSPVRFDGQEPAIQPLDLS
jgi:hypothetical protein